jgi:hypothetical protein
VLRNGSHERPPDCGLCEDEASRPHGRALVIAIALTGIVSCLHPCAAWSQDLRLTTEPQQRSTAVRARNPATASVTPAPESAAAPAAPLQFTTSVDASRGTVLVTATLAGVQVKQQLLTLAAPAMPLDAVAGGAAAKGTVTLHLTAPPSYSAVEDDVVVTAGAQSTELKGQISSWVATGEPVVGEYDQVIMADLSTHTTVRGLAGNLVDMSFVSGSLTLVTLTATQLSPVQSWPYDIDAGSVHVAKGASMTLTIPTKQQSGAVFLQANVSSLATPAHNVGVYVATWSLPPPP